MSNKSRGACHIFPQMSFNITYKWLITGVAGFIGSHLLETLLKYNQQVIGLDNFSSGLQFNLDEVRRNVAPEQWERFTFIHGDICQLDDCYRASYAVDYVLHHAALTSVSSSVEDPISTNVSNIQGFLNMLVASRDSGVKRFVYATSAAVYGDDPALLKTEDKLGQMQSTYGLTKYVDELYARLFFDNYGFESIGLRYFNIYGERQNPYGSYCAVIPTWVIAMLNKEQIFINGDGETTRDFCYIEDVVQVNILAALTHDPMSVNQIYNVASGRGTNLNDLFSCIKSGLINNFESLETIKPIYRDFRSGDIRFSQADITKAQTKLGFLPKYDIVHGLQQTVAWYISQYSKITQEAVFL